MQKGGQIKVCDSSGKLFSTPFLDISGGVNSTAAEAGLLVLVFDPHYLINGVFYVYYTNQAGNAQILQFKVNSNNPNLADSNSEKEVLDIPLPSLLHVGVCLRFEPDGHLYLGIGDGNNSSVVGDPNNNAQNPSLLSGKRLRVKVEYNGSYSVPESNPFRHDRAYRKEVDMQVASSKGGENYGWRCYEGDTAYNTTNCAGKDAYTFPVYVYGHNGSPVADCVIMGRFV